MEVFWDGGAVFQWRRWRRGRVFGGGAVAGYDGAMAKRLFIALELPAGCGATLAALAEPKRGVYWRRPEQMHLTLAFLGMTGEEAQRRLEETLGEVRVPPFWLPIEGVGTFGGGRPSIIWAGVGAGHPHLYALHKRVHDALMAASFDPEIRRFHPHVTLARLKDVSIDSIRPFLRAQESREFCLIEVRSFVLMSSRPGPDGSVYQVERRYDLQGATRTC